MARYRMKPIGRGCITGRLMWVVKKRWGVFWISLPEPKAYVYNQTEARDFIKDKAKEKEKERAKPTKQEIIYFDEIN